MKTSMIKMPTMSNMLAPYQSPLSNHFQYHHCYCTPIFYGPPNLQRLPVKNSSDLGHYKCTLVCIIIYQFPSSFVTKMLSCENNLIKFLSKLLCILMTKWSSKSICWEGFLTFQIACPNFKNTKSKVKTFELRIL